MCASVHVIFMTDIIVRLFRLYLGQLLLENRKSCDNRIAEGGSKFPYYRFLTAEPAKTEFPFLDQLFR